MIISLISWVATLQLEKVQLWVKRIVPALGLLLLPVALFLLHKELKNIHYRDVVANIRLLPTSAIVLAIIFTLLNYLVLTGYDLMGLRFMGRTLHAAKACMASFIGFAFSNSIGFFMVSSGMVRLGLYSNWGLSAGEVAGIITFNGITFLIGLMLVGGGVLLFGPNVSEIAGQALELTLRGAGGLLLAAVFVYMWFCFRRKPLKVLSWQVPVPSPGMAVAQLFISIVDWLLAAGVLYVLLPKGDIEISFLMFFGVFMVAQMLGVASQMPGGVVVFETTVLHMVNPTGDAGVTAALVGPLLVYRAIYYLLPLGIAASLLTTHTVVGRRKHFQQFGQVLSTWMPMLAPPLLTVGVFVTGVILMFSGAVPTVPERLDWLRNFSLLTPVSIELAHGFSMLSGMTLVLLARGLQYRLRAAYRLTRALLMLSLILALLRGVSYEMAVVLLVTLVVLVACRPYFYRHTSVLDERFTAGWIAAIGLVTVSVAWIGQFSYRHVMQDHTLGEIAVYFSVQDGDVSRFLRSLAAILVLLGGVIAWRLLRPAKPAPGMPGPEELARAKNIIRGQSWSGANLAMRGDLSLLFSEAGDAFIMYGVRGGSRISRGGPVGAPSSSRELLWNFRELCDLHQGSPVLYGVSREQLPFCIEIGLTPLKIGEEARIPLSGFGPEGFGREEMRALCVKMEEGGAALEVVLPAAVESLLPELCRVADAWTGDGRDSGRGLTSIQDEAFLKRHAVAVVRQRGRIIAFAVVWAGADKHELSVKNLRYLPDAPRETMDYVFTRLMQWGHAEGYAWFNFGIVPLVGEEALSLMPEWANFGEHIYSHGEHFQHFEGLRYYKERFKPEWEPKYVAYPARRSLARVLQDVADFVSVRPLPTSG